jgi:hypothetical protein
MKKIKLTSKQFYVLILPNNNYRRLMSKLLVTYFEGKTNKREVLEVMARILNFTEEEKQRVGISNNTKWSFLDKPNNQASDDKKTLADLWVDFLLQEASTDHTKINVV